MIMNEYNYSYSTNYSAEGNDENEPEVYEGLCQACGRDRASFQCAECGLYICWYCARQYDGEHYCRSCLN
jgi:hypothetical protein